MPSNDTTQNYMKAERYTGTNVMDVQEALKIPEVSQQDPEVVCFFVSMKRHFPQHAHEVNWLLERAKANHQLWVDMGRPM